MEFLKGDICDRIRFRKNKYSPRKVDEIYPNPRTEIRYANQVCFNSRMGEIGKTEVASFSEQFRSRCRPGNSTSSAFLALPSVVSEVNNNLETILFFFHN